MIDVDKTLQVITFATEFKKRLLARNLRIGRRKCPICGGTVFAQLAGHRNHLHMACETPGCTMRMME